MMNLPGDARDIVQLLSDPAAIVAPPTAPEWAQLVWRACPGAATPAQQRQAQRLLVLRQVTRDWCAAQGLSPLHANEAAFYAVVGAAPDDTWLAALLARLVVWIYALDDAYDHPTLATPQVGAALAHARSALLAEVPAGSARALLRRQMTACRSGMRQEVRWNALLRAGATADFPTPGIYLANGVRSIGILPVMALCCASARDPLALWNASRATIEAAGRVIRLANDIGTAANDALMGKLNALTVAAQGNAADVAEQRALHWLHASVEAVERGSAAMEASALKYCLLQVTAFAYAVYGALGAFAPVGVEAAPRADAP